MVSYFYEKLYKTFTHFFSPGEKSVVLRASFVGDIIVPLSGLTIVRQARAKKLHIR